MPTRPEWDSGRRDCQEHQLGAGWSVFWRWESWWHREKCLGWCMLDLCCLWGITYISWWKTQFEFSFFFFFIPHIKLANKMSRFQWTSGLWRQLWEMNCAKLYHVCAILMSAGELTNAAFKARTTQMSKHWEVYIWNKNVVFTLKTRICFQRRNSSAACLLFSARAGIVTVNSFTVESNICYQSMI